MIAVTFRAAIILLLFAGCASSHKPRAATRKKVPAVVARPLPPPSPDVPGIRLAWNQNPETDVASYRLYYSVTPNGVRRPFNPPVTTTSKVVPQFTFPIYWVVVAINTHGMEGPPSAQIMVPPY